MLENVVVDDGNVDDGENGKESSENTVRWARRD